MRHSLLWLVAMLAAGNGVAQTWTSIGPEPILERGSGLPMSGRVTSIALDRSDARIVYLGTAGGGVWKSIDEGLHGSRPRIGRGAWDLVVPVPVR